MLIYIFVITIKVNVHFILEAVYFQIRKTNTVTMKITSTWLFL